MRILTVVLFVILLAAQNALAQDDNFSRFAKAVGQEISLVDRDGVVREGLLSAVGADQVTMTFGGGQQTFNRVDIFRVERLRDGVTDGAFKGAIFGGLLGLLLGRSDTAIAGTLSYAAIGLLIDAVNTHREPIYQAAVSKPNVKLSLRF